MDESELSDRLRVVEEAVADLQKKLSAGSKTDKTEQKAPSSVAEDDVFWYLRQLEQRDPGCVLMMGSVEVPDAGPVRWQYGQEAQALLQRDWTALSLTIDALAHPARLALVQLVLSGVHATSELRQHESMGTTGQLHHHLRQLVAAGWLISTMRGHYEVPPARVVPLLILIMAATH
ncbi:MAG: hypothetical protein R2722_04935 [Tessaracoccus sp.]